MFVARQPVDLSIVIPLYNEADNVRRLHAELAAELLKLGRTSETIFVDDGSTDGTYGVLEDISSRDVAVLVVRFPRNYGQTAALSAGIERASGQVIVPMDGDLQNDPADIARLLAKMAEGFDCVSGWRKQRKDRALSRRLPSWFANVLISWISGLPLHDFGCTLKAYKRDVIANVRLYGEMHRFIPIYASWQGARVGELVVNHRPRQSGLSKYGLARVLKVALDLLVVKFLFNYLTKPIYVFGGFGLGAFVLSCAALVWAVYFKLSGQKDFVSTPLPLLSAMLFLVGLLSLLMGLLAEIMVRTYYESQDKRPYVVESELGRGSH